MLGVGILFKARQLRAHHGPCLEGDGEPLKETLLPSEGSKASASPRASIPQLGLNSSPVLAKNVMRVASGRLSR